MRAARFVPVVLVVSSVLVACSDTPLGVRVLDAEEGAYTSLCACAEVFGFPDAQACYVNFVARTEDETACVEEAFAALGEGAEETIRCQIDVAEAAQRCFAEVDACAESPARACAITAFAGAETCGAYPPALQDAIDTCYGVTE